MLEAGPGPQILELRLHHRAEVARRVMAELDDATGIAFEDDHHTAADLSGWNGHDSVRLLGVTVGSQ
jgi:hypothetical protein